MSCSARMKRVDAMKTHIEKSRGATVADNVCTVILVVTAAYFIGITIHAAWLGRFAEVAR